MHFAVVVINEEIIAVNTSNFLLTWQRAPLLRFGRITAGQAANQEGARYLTASALSLTAERELDFAGDLKFFIRRDNPNLNSAVGRADSHRLDAYVYSRRVIEVNTEEREATTDA
jgi:hypothetical protein